MPKINFELRR